MPKRLEISMDALELQENGSYRKRASQPITAKPVAARGQLKVRKMNRTEQLYASHLEIQKHLGNVAWWDFEAVKLRLGDDCYFIPDFIIMLADGSIEVHDTKGTQKHYTKKAGEHFVGRIEDDAQVKMRACAERYPFKFYTAFRLPEKQGGTWMKKEY